MWQIDGEKETCGTRGDLCEMLRKRQPHLRRCAERAGVSRGHSKPECEQCKGRRTESVGVFSITEKGGMTNYDRKH